jgi:hypothetical protein
LAHYEIRRKYEALLPLMHMSLDGDAPVAREVERREFGKVVALPRVGGLHHRYVRRAA